MRHYISLALALNEVAIELWTWSLEGGSSNQPTYVFQAILI
jgi:hypothetical protein